MLASINPTAPALPCAEIVKPVDRWKVKMQAANADVQGRLLALVRSILDQNAIFADLNPQTLLVDVGLTSMDMVNLMLTVEAEFDFTIPQEEITPENFQSVETLGRLVVDQLAPATAA
jgi:acyl carrier protein